MWKQPIPTYIPELENNQFILLLFQSILLECSNTDKEVLLKDGTNVSIKRGQCIFGRFKWNKKFYFTKNSQIVERMLRKAQFLNNNLNIKPTNKYTIITVINYDKWVSLEQQDEQQLNNSRTTAEQQLNTSKSIKSVKSEESDRSDVPPKSKKLEAKEFLEGFNSIRGTKYTSVKGWLRNFSYWKDEYTVTEMLLAVENSRYDKFWRDKLDPDKLFRTHEDRIGQLLNVRNSRGGKWRAIKNEAGNKFYKIPDSVKTGENVRNIQVEISYEEYKKMKAGR